jgi:hypothetical protein
LRLQTADSKVIKFLKNTNADKITIGSNSAEIYTVDKFTINKLLKTLNMKTVRIDEETWDIKGKGE